MQGVRAAETRYGFQFPPAYRALLIGGHLKARGDGLLALTDLEWLTPSEIAVYEPFRPLAAPLVPFATTARVDEWCWRLDWQEAGEPAIVLRERGESGLGYAPDFRGFLYRVLLEELSGTWLVEGPDDTEGQAVVRQSIAVAAPHLPAAWADHLQTLAAKPWKRSRDGTVRAFPRSHCDRIVARALAFLHMDEEFY